MSHSLFGVIYYPVNVSLSIENSVCTSYKSKNTATAAKNISRLAHGDVLDKIEWFSKNKYCHFFIYLMLFRPNFSAISLSNKS